MVFLFPLFNSAHQGMIVFSKPLKKNKIANLFPFQEVDNVPIKHFLYSSDCGPGDDCWLWILRWTCK
jgi:hypothetical protein